jgi:hypothetical protein
MLRMRLHPGLLLQVGYDELVIRAQSRSYQVASFANLDELKLRG